jgi:hypothetical protein
VNRPLNAVVPLLFASLSLTFGSAALVAMIVAEGATDLSLWWPMVITVPCALVALAAGIVLGLAHLTRAVLHTPS